MLTCEFETTEKTTTLRHAVVDALVIRDNTILLTQRAARLRDGGKWSLPGGFIDRDERAADAALREVLEETGYATKIDRFLGIIDNPDRGDDRQNIAFVYELSVISQPGAMDPHEVAAMEWFDLSALPDASEMAFDHLFIIQHWMQHRTKKDELLFPSHRTE